MSRVTRSMATASKGRNAAATSNHLEKVASSTPKSASSSTTTTTSISTDSEESSKKKRKRNLPKKVKKKEVEEESIAVERTQSFQPLSHLSLNPESDMKIHTLILGTHPSITSLAENKYFGHPLNAFWWVAGDNLGFRRGTGISPSSGKSYQLTKDLLYSTDDIISYEEQIKRLTSNGFALWDILQSCKRKGSLDSEIKEEQPNKIREFCDSHPSIKRIVLCNGSSSVVFFNRHFKDWWLSGQLKPGSNKESIAAFKKFENMRQKHNTNNLNQNEKEEYADDERIECVCGIGVSPAAAKYTYVEKRDFYKKYCYGPGLLDHERLNP